MNLPRITGLLKETFAEFSKDNCTRLAASLAYYTIFSLAPLLVIAIAIVALYLGQKGATEQIAYQIKGLVGDAGAVTIQSMVESANQPKKGLMAVVIGLITLLFGASGAFGELKSALNAVWEVKPVATSGIWGFVKDRFLSFSMVLGVGFLLLVSLLLSAALAALGKTFGGMMPGWTILAEGLNFALSIGVITVLFAMIFKVLPDVSIAWSDVWHGAFATAVLFTVGKFGLGLYLGRGSVGSSYGAAGSLIVVLLWVYYSSIIMLLGAEFTQVYSRRHGEKQGTVTDGTHSRDEETPGSQNRKNSEQFLAGNPLARGRSEG